MSLRLIAVKEGRRHRHRRFDRAWISAVVVLIIAIPLAVLCCVAISGPSSYELPPALLWTALSEVKPSFDYRAARKIYPYSVVPGGVLTIAEVENSIAADPIVARHYRDIHTENVLLRRTAAPMDVFVSYRIDNAVYWTSHKIHLAKGELLLVDGQNIIRAGCGNRVMFELPPESPKRQPPPMEPPSVVLELGSPPLLTPREPIVPALEFLPGHKPGVRPPVFFLPFVCCGESDPARSSPLAVTTPEPSPLLLLGTGVLLLALRTKPWKRWSRVGEVRHQPAGCVTLSPCGAQVRLENGRCISGMDENRQVANTCTSNSDGNKLQADERRQERTALSVPVQIISHRTTTQNCAPGVCVDISLAGVAFLTDADLHLTDLVELIFEPPNQPAFRRYVRLLYRAGHRYGGYFYPIGLT